MTAMTMPQATSLAETPPLNLKDRQYRAEAIASRINDIRHLLMGIDQVHQERITGYAEHAQLPELIDACDQIASMHVIAVEALQSLLGHADDLVNVLILPVGKEWDAAMQRWQTAKTVAKRYHAQFADGAPAHTAQTAAEADRLDLCASELHSALMEMPAPHLAALRFKLDHLLEDDNGSLNPWTDSYVEQTRRDIARLLGEA